MQPHTNQPLNTTQQFEGSYFDYRMEELGITPEINQIRTRFDCYDAPCDQQVPIFSENKQGDIEILYVGLNGMHTYLKNHTEKPYIRYRLHPSRVINDQKYITPRGAGINIFLPPLLHSHFQLSKPIDTLLVTEGEFKAFKACMHGIPCVGIQGIHNFLERVPEQPRQLNSELALLIKVCQVKNLVFLLDADCLEVSYEADKDLFKRPSSFYTAVKNFRDYTRQLACDTWFAHIMPEAGGKGLDDLMVTHCPKAVKEYVNELKPSQFFFMQLLNDSSFKKLKEYFCINSPESFYDAYRDIIRDQPFIFNRARYKWEEDHLQLEKLPEAFEFLRIGDDYFRKLYKPSATGEAEFTLVKFKKGTLLDDYKKKAPNFIDMISKYHGFCNIASHMDYKEAVNGWYNIYQPMPYQPAPGSCDTSLEFVKHIFGEQYELGLDYLQLLYQRPAECLPVLCLVSREQSTGKSTFAKWLRAIFGKNATKCNNSDLASEFNESYASKLLICIDETFIEKRMIKERIKDLSTSPSIMMNTKYIARQEVPFIGKFVLCSNYEDTFMALDPEDIRFWVRKIKSPKTDNIYLFTELKTEIPAFLHYLANRKMRYPQSLSRMWFPKEVLETEAFRKVVQASRSKLEQEIQRYVSDMLTTFNLEKLEIDCKRLTEELNRVGRSKFDQSEVERCLKEKFRLAVAGNSSFRIPHHFHDHCGVLRVGYNSYKGRYYILTQDLCNLIL
jgi:hypothetical protein